MGHQRGTGCVSPARPLTDAGTVASERPLTKADTIAPGRHLADSDAVSPERPLADAALEDAVPGSTVSTRYQGPEVGRNSFSCGPCADRSTASAVVPGGNGASDADERCGVSEDTGEPVAEAVVIDLPESLIGDSAGPTETPAERDRIYPARIRRPVDRYK